MIKVFREWLQEYLSDPQMVILVFLLVAGFVLIFFMGNMLIPVFASILIAYLLDGIVSALRSLRVPRMPSVLLVFLLFMACLVILLVVLFPMLSRQIVQFFKEMPAKIAIVQKVFMGLPERYPELISQEQIVQVTGIINRELTLMGQRIIAMSLASVKGMISLLVYVIIVPILVFFFLKDKEVIISWLKGFLPKNRGLATTVWNEVYEQFGNYIRGKAWEILIVWTVSFITFKFLGLNFAMLLSLFVGLSVLIPYIGATVMYIPVVLIAYSQWGWSSQFAYTFLAYSIIQLLDGNLLVPLLLSGVVNLHPVAIITAVLVFGGLWGIWGLFFAIPLATLVHAVMKAWFHQRKKERPVKRNSNKGENETPA